MKKTIRIIDLLNKIANGEEVPKKIRVFGEKFELDSREYYSIHSSSPLESYFGQDYFSEELKYEVEILDEEDEEEFEDIETLVLRTFERTGQAITTDRLEDYCDYNFEMIENTIAKIVLNQKKIIERLKESE